MAIAENIGYDASGGKTFKPHVEEEVAEKTKIKRLSCDLFDYRVFYDWNHTIDDWSERRREVIPGTGIVGQWQEFQRDPTPFLA